MKVKQIVDESWKKIYSVCISNRFLARKFEEDIPEMENQIENMYTVVVNHVIDGV